MAKYRVRLQIYIASTILPRTYRCLARPRPDGSHFHQALCRIRQHHGTSSLGWWAPQSQPVPHRWGTPSISSDRGDTNSDEEADTGVQGCCLQSNWTNKQHVFMKADITGKLLLCESLLQARCSIQEMTTFVTVQLSCIKLCADSTFSCASTATISWAAGGLMSVPVTFLFTMILPCHTVENI